MRTQKSPPPNELRDFMKIIDGAAINSMAAPPNFVLNVANGQSIEDSKHPKNNRGRYRTPTQTTGV